MKKLTLLLVAVTFLAGSVDAQSCCKKGHHCSKACAKEKKATTSKDANKATAPTNTQVRAEAPKKAS